MEPFTFCLLVAAVAMRLPSALADAHAAKKAADAGEWEFLRDREARRDARAARRADWAERILARRRAKANGEEPKRAGLGTLFGDVYHGACEDALERRQTRRANRPAVDADGNRPKPAGRLSLRDRVTARLREKVEKLRADRRVDDEAKPAQLVDDDMVDGYRDDLDGEGLDLLRRRRCVWATGSGYCGDPAADGMVYCDPHVAEWNRIYGEPSAGAAPDAPTARPGSRPSDPTLDGPADAAARPPLDDAVRLRHELYGRCAHRYPSRGDGFVGEFCDNPVGADSPYCHEHARPGRACTDESTPKDEENPMTVPTTTPTTTPTSTPATTAGPSIEEVQTNEAARRALKQMGAAAAKLAEAAAMAEMARAQIAAAALAAGDGMASVRFDAGATQSVADINDTVHDTTLHKWAEVADQIQAAAKAGHDSLEKYRVGEEVIAENNVDGRTLEPTAS
jgi:hypothetical protein